ncbi:MAG: hypothetical protein ABW162_15935 [Candidatus Sedimenticola sp. PURPLELP]
MFNQAETFQGGDQQTIRALHTKIEQAETDLNAANERAWSAFLDAELADDTNQAAQAQEEVETARTRLTLLQGALTEAQSRHRAAQEAAKAEQVQAGWSRADYLARKRSELAKKLDRHAGLFASTYRELCDISMELYDVAPATDGTRHTSSLSIQSLDNAVRCTLRHHGVSWAAPGETAGYAPKSVLEFVRESNNRTLKLKELTDG